MMILRSLCCRSLLQAIIWLFFASRTSAFRLWPLGGVWDKWQVEKQVALSPNGVLSTICDGDMGKCGSEKDQDPEILPALINAIEIMQSHYFLIWPGTWPSAIDWTAAVMGTQISATLLAVTDLKSKKPHGDRDRKNSGKEEDYMTRRETRDHENMINQYFTQVASFYHGENAFSLRTQAYDDMLWVVLGWLEAVKFVRLHSQLHYAPGNTHDQDAAEKVNPSIWYAQQFIPQFAHRAHVFYDLASHGWDTTLCGGGMVWNPHLAPYKNAITNQLFIAASIAMYLYFPGDNNSSPFFPSQHAAEDGTDTSAKAHDLPYLHNAAKAYKWLRESNMTNLQGLYIDGFHIHGWRGGQNGSNGTGHCDLRDEKVYTYNQGVVLSGLRGLWDSTGILQYLQDGHELIRNVINATGWNSRDDLNPWVRYRWAGLGRNGVMEESCDASGSCSQNAHTFKGIWWHHITIFCAPLEPTRDVHILDDEAEVLHRRSCEGYGEWVKWNALAAQETKNENGEYGTWWGKHPWNWWPSELETPNDEGTDYRNDGIPHNEVWRLPDEDVLLEELGQPKLAGSREDNGIHSQSTETLRSQAEFTQWDLNDRGRGRTVETQSGGLAVLRALYRWQMWY